MSIQNYIQLADAAKCLIFLSHHVLRAWNYIYIFLIVWARSQGVVDFVTWLFSYYKKNPIMQNSNGVFSGPPEICSIALSSLLLPYSSTSPISVISILSYYESVEILKANRGLNHTAPIYFNGSCVANSLVSLPFDSTWVDCCSHGESHWLLGSSRQAQALAGYQL